MTPVEQVLQQVSQLSPDEQAEVFAKLQEGFCDEELFEGPEPGEDALSGDELNAELDRRWAEYQQDKSIAREAREVISEIWAEPLKKDDA